ncbi:hypothetical protein [Streptosporangium sp. NPDC006007]
MAPTMTEDVPAAHEEDGEWWFRLSWADPYRAPKTSPRPRNGWPVCFT